MCELYTMMRYLQADMLKDCNIDHFDEWAADFGEVKTDMKALRKNLCKNNQPQKNDFVLRAA